MRITERVRRGCRRLRPAALACAVSVGAACASNVAPTPLPPPGPPAPYRLVIGDTLQLSVLRRSDLSPVLTTQLAIDADGTVAVPIVGNLDAEGLTRAELEERLAASLGQHLVDPTITLALLSSTGRRVYVLGEVARPGVYNVDRNATALEAILMAGGFTQDASPTRVILARVDRDADRAQQDAVHTRLDLERLFERAETRSDVRLQPRDILVVPPRRLATTSRVLGHVSSIVSPFAGTIGLISQIVILSRVSNE